MAVPSTYVLYTYFRSSATFRARIAMNLKGLNYSCQYIDLKNRKNKDPSIEKLNPSMKIPIIIPIINGEAQAPLSQSPAIIEYLDEVHPNPPLLPSEPYKKAQVRSICNAIACDMHPLYNTSSIDTVQEHMTQIHGADKAEEYKALWVKDTISESLKVIEQMISKNSGKYSYGDTITMADLFLIPHIKSALRWEVNIQKHSPICNKIYHNAMELEAFKKASPENQEDFNL